MGKGLPAADIYVPGRAVMAKDALLLERYWQTGMAADINSLVGYLISSL
jgi:hypothetical protein